MLDLDATRTTTPTKDAATLLLLRDGRRGPEIFYVERNRRSAFMGGAIVFPGGKVDALDADEAWDTRVTAPHPSSERFSSSARHATALAVAACRESLEEAKILPVDGGALGDPDLDALGRALAESPARLREALAERALRLDLLALVPFARWVTPEAESRRFDARFYLARAPEGQSGAHDAHETVASGWDTPRALLERWEDGLVTLMPPTHRTLMLLAEQRSVDAILEAAASACLDPICPRLVQHKDLEGETLALVLPGDPEHEVGEARVPGPSRYVLRGERWRAGDAPR